MRIFGFFDAACNLVWRTWHRAGGTGADPARDPEDQEGGDCADDCADFAGVGGQSGTQTIGGKNPSLRSKSGGYAGRFAAVGL